MAYSCRNVRKKEPIPVSSNRFEVLKVRVMQKGEGSSKEVVKDRKEILREEKAKRGVEKKEKKEKVLREVMVVRRGSHWGGSPQNGLGDEWTCGTTLASAYVLRRLSAAWSQLQMKKEKSKWK